MLVNSISLTWDAHSCQLFILTVTDSGPPGQIKKNKIFFVKVKPLPKNFVIPLKIYACVKVNIHEKNFVMHLKIYTSKGTRDMKLFSLYISRFTYNEVVRKENP